MDETTMNTSESEDDLPKRKLLEPDKKLSFESMLSIRTHYRHKFQKILAKSLKKDDTLSCRKWTTFIFVGFEDSTMSQFESTIKNFDRDIIWLVDEDYNLGFSHGYDSLIICVEDVVSKESVKLACKAYRKYKAVAFVQMEDESTKKPIKKTYFNKNGGAYIKAIDNKTGKICDIPYFYIDLGRLEDIFISGMEKSWHDEQIFADFLKKVIENPSSYREKSDVDEKDEKFLSSSKSSTVIKNKLLDSLKCACEEKDEQKFFQLISKDDEFSTLKDQSSNTILHMAAKNFDNSQIIEFILKKSHTLLWARNVEYETALMLSLEENNFTAAELLLQKYVDFNKELEVDEMMTLSDVANKHSEIQFLQKFYGDDIKERRRQLKEHIINQNQPLPEIYLSFENWRELFRRHSDDTESPIQLLVTYLPKVAEMLLNKCKKEGDEEYLSELLNDYETNSNDKTALMVFIEEENFEAAETLFNIYNKFQILLKENEIQMMLEAALKNPDVKFLQNFCHDKIILTEDYEEILTKEKSEHDTASNNADNFGFIDENLSIAFIVEGKHLMHGVASCQRCWKTLENNFKFSVLESDSIHLEEFDCWFIFISENINNSEIKLACKAKEMNKPVAFLQTNNCGKLLSESGENYFLTESGKHHIVTLKDESRCEVPLFTCESTICIDEGDFREFLKKTVLFIHDKRVLKEHHNLILSIENKNSEQVLSYLNSFHWQKLFYHLDVQSPLQLLLMNMPETAEALFEKCVQEGEKEYLDELFNDSPANSNKNVLMHFIENQNFDCTKMIFEFYAKYKKQMNENEEKMISKVMDKNNDLKKLYEDLITKEHEYLKTSIENMKHNEVLSYFNSAHWQKLFCRHSLDIQSPVRLLLIHMPEIADKLFEKCVQEGEKEYLVELIDDYPTYSYDLQTLKQNFYSFLSSIGSKIRNPFARTASAQKVKSQVKNE